MKRFVDVLMAVGIFSLAFIIPIGLNRYTTNATPNSDDPGYMTSEAKNAGATTSKLHKLPLDVPLPKGATQQEKRDTGMDAVIITYSLPDMSEERVQAFYNESMDNLGWDKFSDEDGTLAFAKEDGERRVYMTYVSSSSHPKMIMEIDQNW